MYNQFFGNYLFSKGYVTKEQLLPALQRVESERVHLGTLALFSGYMSYDEIEYIIRLQKEHNKSFSELAIENDYLTHDRVLELLDVSAPSFLILGQVLLNDGVFTYEKLFNILTDYRSQNEFLELELNPENRDEISCLIDSFSMLTIPAFTSFGKAYLELLFNNFIRFIGDDFTALPPDICSEFPTEFCVKQSIHGSYEINTYITMDTTTALAFAECYTGETITELNEYVSASLEDFLNLHNGLFIVNASNDHSNELTIGILEPEHDSLVLFDNPAYHFPVCYPFGIMHCVIEIVTIKDSAV